MMISIEQHPGAVLNAPEPSSLGGEESRMTVPFHRPAISEAEIEEVADTLRSGWLTTGPKTKRFEREFARYLGLKHAVGVNSCTAALHLALESIGLTEGQAVLVPTMTFAATAEVVRYLKAVPLLVDCRDEDLNMDPIDARRQLEAARARGLEVVAIILMHYGGQIGDAPALSRLASEENLRIIEDAAHCCPGQYRNDAHSPWQMVGSISDISCFSFYANKCMTTGEGGMACTNSPQHDERMRLMSLHGISRDAWKRFTAEGSWYYEIVAPGFKYNLSDIAASLGIHQLGRASEFQIQRRRVAGLYGELLADVAEVELPSELPNRVHSWHLYSIRLLLDRLQIDRATFMAELKNRGIVCSMHWMPLHMHPYYRETYGYQREDFPAAAANSDRLISLPIYPGLSPGQVGYVARAIREIVARHLKKS
jgi:perosamine synthetase